MGLLVLRQVESQVLEILFKMLPASGKIFDNAFVILLILGVLLLNVDFVKLDDVALELLIVSDVVQALEDVVFELLHVALLLQDLLSDVT